MGESYQKLEESIIQIGSELFRFEAVFEKAIGKLSPEEQKKYLSQFSWFAKRVTKALEDAELHIVNIEGQEYDPGMPVTPLNLEDFEIDEKLKISQMIEPIIMKNDKVVKNGTVLLEKEK